MDIAIKISGNKKSLPEAFDLGDVVKGQIQILQVFHVVKVFHFINDVILQVQDAELAACSTKNLRE